MKKLIIALLVCILLPNSVCKAEANQCEASVSIDYIGTPASFKDMRIGEYNRPLFIDGEFTLYLNFTFGDTSTEINSVLVSFSEPVIYHGHEATQIDLGSVSNGITSKTYVGFEIPSNSKEVSGMSIEVTISASNETSSCTSSDSTIVDIVGNISTLTMYDTDDYKFSNLFKTSTDEWLISNVVKKVDVTKQKSILTEPQHETMYIESWRDSTTLYNFPLTTINNDAISLGYNSYLSLYTTGNYNGETRNNEIEIRPRYYALYPSTIKPLDVYVTVNGKQQMINEFNSSRIQFEWLVNYDYENEKYRRKITYDIESSTKLFTSILPSNVYQGTTNKLYLRAKSRNYLSNANKVRWDFTIGLPSSAMFKESDTDTYVEPEYIICTIQVVAKGNLWNIEYSNEKFKTGDDIKLTDAISVSSETLFRLLKHPETEIPIIIMSGVNRSSDDLTTVGTH